jgi:hypothetical protein
MTMRGLLSLLGGGLNGYNEGTQQQLENDRRAKLDQITLDRASQETEQYLRMKKMQDELQAASAPVVATPDGGQIKPDFMDNRDVGQPGEAALVPSQSVGGQTGLSPMQAQAAAALQNDPKAVLARQMAAIGKVDPMKAMHLQKEALEAKIAQGNQAKQEFDDGAKAAVAKGLQAVVDYGNNSPAATSKSVLVPTGEGNKMEIHLVQPDNSLKPTGLVYSNDQRGAQEAALALAENVPLATKVAHSLALQSADRQDKREETADRRAASTEAYQKAMAAAADRRVDALEETNRIRDNAQSAKEQGVGGYAKVAGGSKSVVDRMAESDKLSYTDALATRKRLEQSVDDAIIKGEAKETDPQIVAMRKKITDMGVRADQIYTRSKKAQDIEDQRNPSGLDPNDPARLNSRVGPQEQAARDAAGGKQSLRDEYMNDPAKARDAMAKTEAALRGAKNAEERVFLQQLLAEQRAAVAAGQRTESPMTAAKKALPADTTAPVKAPVAAQRPLSDGDMPLEPAKLPTTVQGDIPPPPPETVVQNVRTPLGMRSQSVPNPAYQAWKDRFGKLWAEQQAATMKPVVTPPPGTNPYALRRP